MASADLREERLTIMKAIIDDRYAASFPITMADGRIAATDGRMVVIVPRFDLPDELLAPVSREMSEEMAKKIAAFVDAPEDRYRRHERIEAVNIDRWSDGPIWDQVERDPEIPIGEEALRMVESDPWFPPIRHGSLFGWLVDRVYIAKALRIFGALPSPMLIDVSMPSDQAFPMRMRIGERSAYIMGIQFGFRAASSFWSFEESIGAEE